MANHLLSDAEEFSFASPRDVLHIMIVAVGGWIAMVLFEKHEWGSELQRGLDRDSVATMEVCVGEDSSESTQPASCPHRGGLTFGPYGSSPITGLHFETADDTAVS